MKKILLVDDEQRMLDLLALYLSPYNFTCIKKSSGYAAIDFLKKEDVNLVILDVMMPDLDGWITCEKIRKFSNVPIIMLTARSDKIDILKGFHYGSDDYVTKPFDEEVLLARIQSLLKRAPVIDSKSQIIQGIELNLDEYQLRYQSNFISLTPKEFSMLSLFLKNPNKVFSRKLLLDLIWGHESNTDNRTIDSHIRNLREKLRQQGYPIDETLKTVWGIGYRWIGEK